MFSFDSFFGGLQLQPVARQRFPGPLGGAHPKPRAGGSAPSAWVKRTTAVGLGHLSRIRTVLNFLNATRMNIFVENDVGRF